MSEPVKLRATMTWTIEAQPHWYEDNATPEKMAEIESAADLESALAIGAERPDFKFTVTPVKDGGSNE